MTVPLISIVVPTLNQGQFIGQALASIVGQRWPHLELIVIDGGSTDATSEIVSHYPVTHFVSERDSGQAEAINKGMRLARGDILAWLNSDDYYLPLAFQRIAGALGDTRQPRLVHGSCLMLYEREARGVVARAEHVERDRLATMDLISQPSAFWTRALWERTGELTERYQFELDWEWWLRALDHGEFCALDEILSVYRFHAGHKTSSGSPQRTKEIIEVVEKYAGREWAEAYRALASRLDRFHATWRVCAHRRGLWTLHQLVHASLYLRHGRKVEVAFSQLHV